MYASERALILRVINLVKTHGEDWVKDALDLAEAREHRREWERANDARAKHAHKL